MLERATAHFPTFSISDIENRRQGYSFTIDTLRELAAEYGQEAELVFVMGFDAFAEMGTWKEYSQIPEYALIAVCARDGNAIFDVAKNLFGDPALVQPFTVPPKDISSSQVRMLLKGERQEGCSLLPEVVFNYIKEKKLFL
jgi:nicotinate-nucleotide adenylyltransferase